VASKLWAEISKEGLHWVLLFACLFAGYMASKDHANATSLITLCEKGEKLYKFVSHFIPIVVAIYKSFR
jgi:hypothetical protein